MKVLKTQAKDFNGPIAYNREDPKAIDNIISELKLFLDCEDDFEFTISTGEMTEEEFNNMPEFGGY